MPRPMEPERWRRISGIYHEAQAHPAGERDAFVRAACGNDEALRLEVASLLHQPSGDGFLSQPPEAPPASLTGLRIGVFELQELIGAGGMGEVYRARDSRLGRDVAIKILPARFTNDPERLARFEREARLLAALNHPNIAAIYGVEEGAGARGLVLELVDGETLAERLARGPLAVPDAIAVARAIVDALEAAHERDIIHRDLKPANVKVTSAGVVKVLDFGLAKSAPPVADGGAGVAPSATPGGTKQGLVLGTLPYMSPEQARGLPVDKRTDVWAFGCVLYEMLTARAAFGGETAQDTVAAILEREPDYARLPASTPQSLRRLIARSVVKDPKRRLRDIGDARLEFDESGRKDMAPAVPAWWRRRSLPAGWIVAAAAIAVASWLAGDRVRAPARDTPAPNATLAQITFDSGLTTTPAVSPDGRLLAVASDRAGRGDLDIWVHQADGGVPLRITDDPADDLTPDFSPDGRQIAFRSERGGGGIYLVSTLGGPARLALEGGRRPRFSPDGSRLAYWTGQFRGVAGVRNTSVFVAPLDGGTPTRVAADLRVALDPVWAPDGRSLVILGRRDDEGDSTSVDWWWVPLDGRPPVSTGAFATPALRGTIPIQDEGSPAAWTSAGVLFAANGGLWSMPLSMRDGRPAGAAERLTLGTAMSAHPAAAPGGGVVFSELQTRRVVERVPLTPAGPQAPASRLYTDNRRVALRTSTSANGAVIVFEQVFETYLEIWARNTRTGRDQMVLRAEGLRVASPTLSPDGRRIAYNTGELAGSGSSYVIEVDGGVPRLVCEECLLGGFLADSRRVLGVWGDRRTIGVIDTAAGTREELVRARDSRLNRPHASPDDRWLAFRELGDTGTRVFVVPLTPGRPQLPDAWQPVDQPTTTGRPCGWSLDGRTMLMLLDTDGFRCLWGQRVGPGGLTGAVFPVHHFHGGQMDSGGPSTSLGNPVTAEGFLYERIENTGNVWRLTPGS
jgi:eukaryotic-like serine/threonine-protein kinase